MFVCSSTFGYNWSGQPYNSVFGQGVKDNLMDRSGAIFLNAYKIADYIPLISIISGVFKIAIGSYVLVTNPYLSFSDKVNSWVLIGRGVLATFQLGSIFLVIDVIVTLFNVFIFNIKK